MGRPIPTVFGYTPSGDAENLMETLYAHFAGSSVTSLSIVLAGTGYAVNDAITLGAPDITGGVQATAEVATIGGSGEVTGVTILVAGSGYTSAPTVTFGAGGATGTANIAVTSSDFDITGTQTGTNTGADGFTITPSTAPTFQANFRRTSTSKISGHIDPGSTTAPGDATPTLPTKSSLASNEIDVLPTINTTGNICLILEWDDAFMVLVEDSTNAFYASAYHAGQIMEPFVQDYIAQGTDGLGILGGKPGTNTFSWNYSVGSSENTFRINNTGTEAVDWQQSGITPNPATSSTTSNFFPGGGYYGVCPISRYHSTTQRWYGVMKYCWLWYPSKTFKTRLQNPVGGEDLYMAIGGGTIGGTTGPTVVPWPDNTDPDNL